MMKSLTFFCFALLGLVQGQNPCCSVPVFETVEEFITGTTMSGRSYEEQVHAVKRTVLPVKSDSDVMFCLKSYRGLIIDRSLVY